MWCLRKITSATSYQSQSLKEGKEDILEEQKKPQKTVIFSLHLSFLSSFSPLLFPILPCKD